MARRFVKGTQKLSTVLITFGCKEDLEHCLEHGLTIGRSPETVHPYRASPKVLQFWKCWRFDHTAAWCSKKKNICQYCAQVHEKTECLIHTENAMTNPNVSIVKTIEIIPHHPITAQHIWKN